MSDADYIHALNLPIRETPELDEDVRAAFGHLESEHGLVPNVLKAYSFDQEKLRFDDRAIWDVIGARHGAQR